MAKIKKQVLVEVARSFSYKLNLGNYSTADFFCSKKMEVPESQSEKISEELFQFCVNEVEKSVVYYQKPKNINAGENWDEHKQELADENSKIDDILKEANTIADVEANKIF